MHAQQIHTIGIYTHFSFSYTQNCVDFKTLVFIMRRTILVLSAH